MEQKPISEMTPRERAKACDEEIMAVMKKYNCKPKFSMIFDSMTGTKWIMEPVAAQELKET